MTRISIELTPRSLDSLVNDLRLVTSRLPSTDMINILGLLRTPIRSWEGCRVAKQFYGRTVPHIRAIDLDLQAPLPMAEYLPTRRAIAMQTTATPSASFVEVGKNYQVRPGTLVVNALGVIIADDDFGIG